MKNNILRDLYLLDPSVIFLNHGSFGATPIPVMEEYQRWQITMEKQPVEFLGRRISGLLSDSRQILANYLGTQRDNLVYVPNATTAINIVARSLNLRPGDEVLATDHEYGAMDRTWRFLSEKIGFQYRQSKISIPLRSKEDFLSEFAQHITPKTKVIFLSHITSPTGLIFPIQTVIEYAHRNGILTVVDGAHAPGQIPLHLDNLDVDFYTGNLHKWLSSPKGSAFLFANPRVQHIIEPLVVSWGWQAEFPSSSQFIDYLEWPGTQDFSAYLSVPSAIKFQEEYQWENIRNICNRMLREFRSRISNITQLPPTSPEGADWHLQMESFPLSGDIDINKLKDRLYREYRIEVPIILWQGLKFVRVSVQGYNTESDLEVLLEALVKLISECM